MISLVSSASPLIPMEVVKAALPIGIGLASAVYLTVKIATNSSYGGDKVKYTTPTQREGDWRGISMELLLTIEAAPRRQSPSP